MADNTIEIEAETLEEAREQVKSRIPEGLYLLSERVISDGKPKTARCIADKTGAAFEKAQDGISSDVAVIQKKELTSPAQNVRTVEAFDEQSARTQLESQIGNTAKIKSLRLAMAGKKGFLGIGKKPNQYDAEVCQQAVVEITYKAKAKISATVGGLSSLPAERLIGEYLRHRARQWWAAQPESRTVATCDACGGQPVSRNEGHLVGSSLWCDDCYADKDVEGQLRRDPNAAGFGVPQEAQRWAAAT
jgi:hypothetical protein